MRAISEKIAYDFHLDRNQSPIICASHNIAQAAGTVRKGRIFAVSTTWGRQRQLARRMHRSNQRSTG
jgi:hypothetical protein